MDVRQIKKCSIDFTDAMEIAQNAIMTRLNCHNIGKIIEFDASTQTCTVQIMALKQFYNDIINPAPITNVPLIMYGADNSFITLPNPVGSICLLFFLDRNIDAFMKTGEQYLPETTRTHDFTDCIAITTFSTLNNPIQNYDNNAISIIYNKIIEQVAYESIIKNYANSILMQSTDGTSTADVNLNIDNTGGVSNATLKASVTNGVNTSTLKLDNLITIQNTSQNLGTLIKSLIQTIKAITITNSAVSNTSKNALDVVATNFAALLKETE